MIDVCNFWFKWFFGFYVLSFICYGNDYCNTYTVVYCYYIILLFLFILYNYFYFCITWHCLHFGDILGCIGQPFNIYVLGLLAREFFTVYTIEWNFCYDVIPDENDGGYGVGGGWGWREGFLLFEYEGLLLLLL